MFKLIKTHLTTSGIVVLIGCLTVIGIKRLYSAKIEPSDVTVKITNLKGNSGGSGTVVKSASTNSYVLTNKHICEILVNGGKVTKVDGTTHLIRGMIASSSHDLCMINISADLGKATTISNSPPQKYDQVLISGHPSLLPNVKTQGHISDQSIIRVFMGVKPCTPAEQKDRNTDAFCFFFGGIPLLKTFESTVVSSLISPGSSGSGVYNSEGEVVAVAFAGSGNIGYAHTVPYAYVKDFVDRMLDPEMDDFYTLPNYVLNIAQLSTALGGESYVEKCKKENLKQSIKEVCSVIIDTLRWRN